MCIKMWGAPLSGQCRSDHRQKDTKMKLLYVFATLLALSLGESELEHYDDLVAAESIELQKTDLKPEASVYASVPYPSWNQPSPNQPAQNWPQPPWNQKPQTQPLPQVQPPYFPPQPSGSYVPGFNPGQQSDYVPPQHPHPQHTTTTTPVPVIKNDQWFGKDGSYRYEYKIADGTWVGEEGWFTSPEKDEKSLVKKGWYQYVGGDGKTYTVTYWADNNGYHAHGEHLPTPPPIPPAIQASIDENAKEEAAKAEAEKNKPYYPPVQKPVYYDPPQEPQQIYYPPQQPQQPQQPQTYYPPQQSQQPQQPQQPQTYYPPQQTYYPQTNYPSGK